jgi:hypothetical protein
VNDPRSINIKDPLPFPDKMDGLVWRGTTTGDFYGKGLDHHLRFNFIKKVYNVHPSIDVGFSKFHSWTYEQNREEFNRFTKPVLSRRELVRYKFVLILEGNDVATSFPWVLASNCCPLHNYPFTWETHIFGQGLEPYIHFIPVKNDGSDLLEQYEWCMNNLDKCEEIAQNGTRYMEPYLDEELFYAVIKRFAELYPLKIPSG